MQRLAAGIEDARQPGLWLGSGRIDLSDGDRAFSLIVPELALAPGQTVALTGASGSGKTLLLEMLGLLRAPGRGTEYLWRDASSGTRDLAALWAGGPRNAELAAFRGRLFGFVPQTGGLMPFLNVMENVALPQQVTGREDVGWCRTLIERLGLGEVAGQLPARLSIGQRQRTAIARALAHRPPFVIADEPTAALDPDSADEVLSLLLETASEGGSGVILSSHDIERMARFGIERLVLATRTAPDGTALSELEARPC